MKLTLPQTMAIRGLTWTLSNDQNNVEYFLVLGNVCYVIRDDTAINARYIQRWGEEKRSDFSLLAGRVNKTGDGYESYWGFSGLTGNNDFQSFEEAMNAAPEIIQQHLDHDYEKSEKKYQAAKNAKAMLDDLLK